MKDIHKKLAKIAEEYGAEKTLVYLEKVVNDNKAEPKVTGCPGHQGECGVCVDGVFIACGD